MKAVTKERIAIVCVIAVLLWGVEPTPPRIAAAILGGCLFWWLAGRLRRPRPSEQPAPPEFPGKG